MCRAALAFWLSVSKNSNFHPSDTPAVEGMFKEYAVLCDEEIVSLLDNTPKLLYVTVQDIAKTVDRKPAVILYHMEKLNVQPDFVYGKIKFYNIYQVQILLEKLKCLR